MISCPSIIAGRTGLGGAPAKCLGVVGGLGPMATARLYLEVCQRVQAATRVTPAVIIDSVCMPRAIEESFITAVPGAESERMLLAGIRGAVGRLVAAGASALCAACNTVQPLFMAEAARFDVAVIGMAEAAMAAVHRSGYRKALVLASSSTRRVDVYGSAARALGISLLYPEPEEQAEIFGAILNSTHYRVTREVSRALASVCRRYESQVDCVLLGCTDLSQIKDEPLGPRPVIDSLSELAMAAAGYLGSDA